MSATKTKKAKKAGCKQESVAESGAVSHTTLEDTIAIAKKCKKRKREAVEAGSDADVQANEASTCRKQNKKGAIRKIVKRVMSHLSDIQTQLSEVQTAAQLKDTLLALKLLVPRLTKAEESVNPGAQEHEAIDVASQGSKITNETAVVKNLEPSSCKRDIDVASQGSQISNGIAVVKNVKPSSFKRDFATWPVVSEKVAAKRRAALSIEIEDGNAVVPPIRKFAELEVFPEWLNQALEENGWSKPTPIQSQALPVLMSGCSFVGVAQTGSGKTGAFLLPAIVQIEAQAVLSPYSAGPIALVLAPTRELAVQISEEADKLLKYSSKSGNHSAGIFSACFYGGGRKQDQLRRFTSSGSHILVATPGRLADCVTAKDISLSRVTYLVLDEADRMLDEGFSGEVGQILSEVRSDRQVALFSATWPASVQELAKSVMPACDGAQNTPVRIRVGASPQASGDGALQARESITQEVVVIDYPSTEWQKAEEEKRRLMESHVRNVLTTIEGSKVLVFVNTKVLADSLSTKLWQDGFKADSMHGGRPQETRLNVLRRFRENELRLLVVTDVFARGLDIPQVSHVVIYEMGSTEDYIHRIGRTGRGVGGTGHALVFFEYWPGYPAGAEELIGVLERSKQKVPEGLRAISAGVRAGKRPTR